jgi:predicted transposase YbfD/YdcC
MDRREYTQLAAALGDVPDPRAARGQRYPWSLLLVLISAAVASGQSHARAISQWVHEQATPLRAALDWQAPHWPSEATLRRALRDLDVAVLDACVGSLTPGASDATSAQLVGLALDGKTIRGARRHGQVVHLVSLVTHSGQVLAQTAVAAKANELVAAPDLVAGRDLRGTLTTMDALHTQRPFAELIRKQGGQYLMVVKDNQPLLAQAIASLFAAAPWLSHERDAEYALARTVEKGHGRLETRVLEASPSLNTWLDWPDVGQVLRRTCRRVDLRTGVVTEAVTLGITSLPFVPGQVAQVERFWRGHWSIENKVHYVRDVSLGEDAGQAHTGATARALAALRNAVLTLIRARRWRYVPDAIRHYAADPKRALDLIGVPVTGL